MLTTTLNHYKAGDRNGVKGAKQALALALDSIREPARIIVGLWEFEIVRICLNAYVLSGYSPMLGVQAGVNVMTIWQAAKKYTIF
jgi:hypothetical protein